MNKPRFLFAVVLGFVGFVTSFGAHIVAVNLPTYAARVGVGVAMIGLLIAAYDLAEIVAKPIFGALADKSGMKRTMLLGIIFFTLASMLYLFIPPQLLLLVRFLQGIGAAALSAVSLALVGAYYETHRGTAYGIYNAIKGAGYVVSPLVGGYLVATVNFNAVFVASAFIGGAALLISLPLPAVQSNEPIEEDDLSFRNMFSVFSDPVLRPWYLVTIMNMFFVSILFGFFPVYLHDVGYSPLASGMYLSIVATSYLLIQPLAGWAADRWNPVATILIGLLLAAFSIVIAPFTTGVTFGAVSVLSGVGVGIVWTNTDTAISKVANPGSLATTMGAAGSFKELGDMIGPLIIGVLAEVLGLRIGFALCGGVGIVISLLLMRFNHNLKAAI